MKVTTVKVKEGQALVEWMDEKVNLHRAWFPVEEVVEGEVKSIDRGLEYGDDFATLIHKLPTKHDIVQALHNQGLWSFNDLAINPAKVQIALTATFVSILNTMLIPMKEE